MIAMNKNRSGMSLIEVMVAMLLFSVGILSLGMLIPASQQKIMKARQRTSSVAIAQQLMDQVISSDYLAMDSYNGASLNPVPGTTAFKASIIVMNSSAQGDTATASQDPDFKKVIVMVRPIGAGDEVSMSTVVPLN